LYNIVDNKILCRCISNLYTIDATSLLYTEASVSSLNPTPQEAAEAFQGTINQLSRQEGNAKEAIPSGNAGASGLQSLLDSYDQLKQLVLGQITPDELLKDGGEDGLVLSFVDPVADASTKYHVSIARWMAADERKELEAQQQPNSPQKREEIEEKLVNRFIEAHRSLGVMVPKPSDMPGHRFIAALLTLGRMLEEQNQQ
jgi:hypothetical protein